MLLSRSARRLDRHGTGHHAAGNSRRFNPLAQPLEASQKLGGRELVWRFDGGDITSDGGVLALKKLDARPLSRGFAVALRNNFRSGILAPQGRLRKRCKWLTPTQIS